MRGMVQMKTRKRVGTLKVRRASTKYVAVILGEDEKHYSANIGYAARKVHFFNAKERTNNKQSVRYGCSNEVSKVSCLFQNRRDALKRNANDLVGVNVVLIQRNKSNRENKIVRGKIISVQPYIIGTPPGGGELPPIDE